MAHEVFVEQAVAAHDEALRVKPVHQLWCREVGAGAYLGQSEFFGLLDDRVVPGDVAHRHEPALGQSGVVGCGFFQPFNLERGYGYAVIQAVAAHHVYCTAGKSASNLALLDLDVEVEPALVLLQRLAERAHWLARVFRGEPAAGVHCPKLIQREAGYGPGGVGRPVHSVVVDYYDVVVAGQMDVKLDMVNAHRERLVVGGKGVLGRIG